MFRKALHKRMALSDFSLETHLDRPQKVVATFFGSNTSYFDNDPKPGIKIPSTNFEVESYLELLSNKQSEQYDDRVSAIEIVTDHAILLKGNVQAIAFPGTFMEDEAFAKSFQALNCLPLPYPLGARIGNQENFGKISLIVRDYLFGDKGQYNTP